MTTEQPSSPETSETDEQNPDQPLDTKARFRQALDRKNSRQHAGATGGVGDHKSQGAHGAAGGQRMFRRKSGG